MSMSMGVYGIKPPDEKWKKFKAVYDACEAAGVDPPKEVYEFFNYEPPDNAGVKIEQETLEKCGAIKEYRDQDKAGYSLLVEKLPKDITMVRFANSW